jgi:hypothetical protein
MLFNVPLAMVKGLTWMDLYVGDAKAKVKLPIVVHQKTRERNMDESAVQNHIHNHS